MKMTSARSPEKLAYHPTYHQYRDCNERIHSGRADSVMMRWSELRHTRAEGVFEFHSHTASHTRWDKICATPAEKTENSPPTHRALCASPEAAA